MCTQTLMWAAPVNAGLGSARERQPLYRLPAWPLWGAPSREEIVKHFSSAMMGRQDEFEARFFKPKTIKYAQRMVIKRAVRLRLPNRPLLSQCMSCIGGEFVHQLL